MSGIVGILRRDGAPVGRPLLRALTQFLCYRGPDGRETWADGPVGLGHTLLRTDGVSRGERQPTGLDGRFQIVADARLDCHAELEAELDSADRRVRSDASDAELILQAYAAWGEDCVEHLRGDFAFAIWDARRRALFCARDHFGVKPFYYADLGDTFLIGNTLDCLRLHPHVSDALNEEAIADFLLFGLNCDVATTTFRDIRRLPAGHSLTVSFEGVRIGRYWSAPTDGRIRYRKNEDYVEHFRLLLGAAVRDRIRTDRAGIWLSGGMDSSSVAATAREVADASRGATELYAFTVSSEAKGADAESLLACQVAEFLQIPIRVLRTQNPGVFDRWDQAEWAPAEPVEDPFFAGLYDQYAAVAERCRVALSGEGSDNLLFFQMLPYARDLLRRREWGQLAGDGLRFLSVRQFPWKGLRLRAQRALGRADEPKLPRWIAPDFARRVDLEARWRKYSVMPEASHPVKPVAHASLVLPQWTKVFEQADPGVTRSAVEVRYPYLDLRVVNYLLAIPPFPWAFQKRLVREAMVNRLPENIRCRPKTPLAHDPQAELLQPWLEKEWRERAHWDAEMDRYIRKDAASLAGEMKRSAAAAQMIRPICLNFWLQRRLGLRYNLIAEAFHG